MNLHTTTLILAIWGAVVSTFAVGWQFYRDLVQRGRLRVSCYIGIMVGGGVRDPNKYLVYNVTNIGREPVMLTHIGGRKKKNSFILNPHQRLPRMLKPGEYVLEYSHSLEVLGQELVALTATDSLGRTWKAPRRQVRKLKSDYAAGAIKPTADS